MNRPISQHLYNKLLVTIFVLNLTEFLHSGMIAFAANSIMGETGTAPVEFGMISGVYAAIAITMIALHHWFIERLGWRYYVQMSLILFMLGALVCFFSHTFYTFLVGRTIMALGGASFMTSARLVALLVPPGPVRLIAIKSFVVSMTVGLSLAPWFVSFIISYDRWNLIFLLLIFFGIIAFIFASSCLPSEPTRPEERMTKSNPYLILFLLVGAFLFFYVFRWSSYMFFNNSTVLFAIFMVSFIFLAAFFHRLKQTEERPLIHVRPLVQNKAFVFSTVISCVYYMMNAANNYIFPFVLQKGLNFPWVAIGFFMSLGLSVSLVCWVIYIKLIFKYPGMKKFCLVGCMAITFYGYILSNLTPQADIWHHIFPAIFANGIFVIMFVSPLTGAGLRSLQQNDLLYTHAMQVRNMLAQLALAVGVTFGTVFMQWRTTYHFSVVGTNFQQNNPVFMETVQSLTAVLSRSMPPDQAESAATFQLQQMLYQQSTLMSGIDYFHGVMFLGVIVALYIIFQKNVK